VKFQDKVFSKFQDILTSQNVENITSYVPQISHKHPKGAITITKAMLHKIVMTVTVSKRNKT